MRSVIRKMGIAMLALCVSVGIGKVSAQAAQEKVAPKVKSVSIKTNTGGDFVKGVSKANVTFRITGEKSDVTVEILSGSGKKVYSKVLKNCSVNKSYTLAWNGKGSNGKYTAGEYRAKVTAGKSSKKSGDIRFFVKSDFAGGDGSKSKPYKVATIAQFKNIVNHNGMNFVQTKNLNFSGKAFLPLFTEADGFTGVYDGKGLTISGINYTTETECVGLFRAITEKGCVKGVKLDSCTFLGKAYVGGIAGRCYGKILNCSAVKCMVSGEAAGAIAGYLSGTATKCRTQENIVSAGGCFAGGIVGYCEGSVQSCESKEDTVSAGTYYAGGVVGVLKKGMVSDCTVTESNVAADQYVGGIAGYCSAVVKNCTVRNEKSVISGSYYFGGIVGRMEGGGLQTGNTYYGDLNLVGTN